MVRRDVQVRIPEGLPAGPVALLVQKANEYNSTVYFEFMQKRVNVKSIMGVMSLTLGEGDTVTIVCDGSDEGSAAETMERFLLGTAV